MAPITVTHEEVAQYGKLTQWQRLIFIKDHWPQIFWPEVIGIVLAIGVVCGPVVGVSQILLDSVLNNLCVDVLTAWNTKPWRPVVLDGVISRGEAFSLQILHEWK